MINFVENEKNEKKIAAKRPGSLSVYEKPTTLTFMRVRHDDVVPSVP